MKYKAHEHMVVAAIELWGTNHHINKLLTIMRDFSNEVSAADTEENCVECSGERLAERADALLTITAGLSRFIQLSATNTPSSDEFHFNWFSITCNARGYLFFL
jgi:hypothetical protein